MMLPTEETYEAIYQICVPKLMTYLQFRSYSIHDAEDIVSRAMMLLWERWDDLPSHTYKGILCWLLTTVRNMAHEEDRRRAHFYAISLNDLPPQMHPTAPPDIPPEQREEEYRQYLKKLTEQLSGAETELLLDKIERHMSDREIAEHLGITVNAVRIRWMRTKEHIAQIMKLHLHTD